MSNRFTLERLLSQMGGRYIVMAVAAAQVIGLLGAIPGILSIQINADFSESLRRSLAVSVPVLIILSNFSLLGIGWAITRSAQKRLNLWTRGSIRPDPAEEFAAWQEITRLTWRYGISAGFLIFFVTLVPSFILAWVQGSNSISSLGQLLLTAPEPIYILWGGIASILGYVILQIILIDRFLLPARLILALMDFETELRGRSGVLLRGKFMILNLTVIVVAILLISSVSLQHLIRILNANINPIEIIGELQVQSILISVMALALGVFLSYYVSRAIAEPIRELIKTFDKIEQGDLSQRAAVGATDELGIVTMHFNRMVARLESLQTTLEQQVVERTKQLAAMNEVGRVASSSLDPDELLAKVIHMFPEKFGYYYAAIYLLDASEKWAQLREATGEAGKVLKQNRYRLEVAGKSMVGTAIREKATRIAQVASEEKRRYDNPLLPYTRSEIALPLIVGDRVLGALSVQSTKESDFGPQVVETMQNMAGQVAIALENARLFQEAQHNLREMRMIQQQYLLEGWSGFISQKGTELEYLVGDESDEDAKQIEVPIRLRDQVLGLMRFESSKDWTPEQESLANAVATQAAIAVENARLISESRQIAVYERMLAEISSKIWSSATIDGVLQTAVKELGRRLSASQATIELNLDESP